MLKNVKAVLYGVGAVASVIAVSVAHAAEPVAMATDVTGAVWTIEAGKPQKLGVLSYLAPGTRLKLDDGARLVITYFANPVEQSVRGPASVTVNASQLEAGGAKAETRKLARDAAEGARSLASQRQRVTLAAFEMKAPMSPLQPLSPADSTILETRPRFSWAALPGAQGYRLLIKSQDGKQVREVAVSEAAWSADADLARGGRYRWQAAAKTAEGERAGSEAEFEIADEKLVRQLDRARPKAAAPFSERALFAARLEAAGLRQAAREARNALAAERPGEAALQR